MTHLRPDELVDAAEGALASTRRPHLDACAACRSAVQALAATLAEATAADVPEPSPLFWDHLSARVHDAIRVEPPPRPAGFEWRALVPLAGLALLVVALVSAVGRHGTPADTPDVAVASEIGVGTADDPGDAWTLVASLIEPLDVETARQAGLAPGLDAAERAVLELDAAEREALLKLLQAELNRAGG